MGTTWTEDAQGLHKQFAFKSFEEAVAFVFEAALLARAADHHPDIDIRYDQVALTLLTHSAGKVTEKDRSLAAQIDAIGAETVARRATLLFPA